MLTVVATHREEYPEGISVYNFRVKGTHTYFVRQQGSTGDAIWVHNANYKVKEADESDAPITGRPNPKTKLPDRVTKALPAGDMREPGEVAQARNFFERNRDAAEQWWSQRNGGQPWPEHATNAGHPRAIADGGDPLDIVPEFYGPNAPHMVRGPDGLTDFQRWGMRGGRPRKS
jgi:hypothetical protein